MSRTIQAKIRKAVVDTVEEYDLDTKRQLASSAGAGLNFTIRAIAKLGAVGLGLFGAMPCQASEGGASFYLLGSGGPEAAILPPVEGVFFDSTTYIYDGAVDADIPLVVGGNVVAGLDATIAANFATALWVPSTDVRGGTLALSMSLPIGYVDVDASAVITGPGGQSVAINRSDDAVMIGDPVATAAMTWQVGDKLFLQPSATVNVPIGTYRKDQLANLAFHRWILDTSVAMSWHDDEAGWDVSGKAGVTFNGTNPYTDYKTGTEFHAEAAVERIFSPQLSAGLQAYYFDQWSGDSGAGAVLGPNKGRVAAVGVTGAYTFEIGKTPVTARVRAFEEFDARRRMEGTALFFSLTLPLSMKIPSGEGQ